jgi:5''-3'' exonuclease (including N-terminal domain of PolI)
LVIDGDSFAHRSYHALPKTILGRGGRPAGAILGFANVLLRLYRAEQPRAVLVAWDTLEVPTDRHTKFPPYQSGRSFDAALLEQLAVLPEFVAACGFANAKAAGYEADDFLAAAAAAQERRGGTTLVASGDRDTFQLASNSTTILYPVRAGEMARIGPAEVRARMGWTPGRSRISSRCGVTRRTSCPGPAVLVLLARQRCCASTAPSKPLSVRVASPRRRTACGSFAGLPP